VWHKEINELMTVWQCPYKEVMERHAVVIYSDLMVPSPTLALLTHYLLIYLSYHYREPSPS